MGRGVLFKQNKIIKEEKTVKRSISKFLSAILVSAMTLTSISVPAMAAQGTSWGLGVDNQQITSYTVTAARNNPTLDVPVKVYNNTDLENYTVYVNYDPSEIRVVGVTQGDFSLATDKLESMSMNHVPDVNNIFFNGVANGTSTEAELGRIKFAYSADVARAEKLTASEATLFTLKVQLVKASPASGDRYWINFTTDEGAAMLYSEDNTTSSSTAYDGYIAITATQGGSGGGGGGGGGSPSRVTTTTTTTSATEATEATTKTQTHEPVSVEITNADGGTVVINPPVDRDSSKGNFTDLDGYDWAKDSIQKLAELGIISGVGDGLFGPGLPCKRCDFAILINRALGVQTEITKNFTDNVDQSKYYYTDCAMGYSAGILSGYGDNNYKPENYCTREEMFVLTAKTLEYLGEDVTSTSLDVNNKYTDVADISWWSAPYCAYLTDKQIVNGNTDGTVNPDAYITRAEMAVMIDKDYEYAIEVLNKAMQNAAAANQQIIDEGAYGETTHVDDDGQTLVVTQELLVEMSAKLTEYADIVTPEGQELTGDAKTEFDEAIAEVKAIAEQVKTEIAEDQLDDVNSDILGTATRLYELATNNSFSVDYQTGFDELKAIAAEGVQKN